MDSMGWDVAPTSYLWGNNHDQSFVGGENYTVGSIFGFEEASGPKNGPQFMISTTLPSIMDNNNNIINASPLDQNLAVHQDREMPLVSTAGSSLDSLDHHHHHHHCLLTSTGTNSINTDTTSVEDDGISMIFSECRNLWNFGNCFSTSAPVVAKEHGKPKSNIKRSHDYSQIKMDHTPSTNEGSFKLITEYQQHQPNPKKLRSTYNLPSSSNISFQQPNNNNSPSSSSVDEQDSEAIAQMKEMIYRAAIFRPVILGPEIIDKPKRKNVRISKDPQTVAARERRERISERIRVLQRLVPGGNKMDTASMLDEAANYLKFLRSQVKALENVGHKFDPPTSTTNYPFINFPHFSIQNMMFTDPRTR